MNSIDTRQLLQLSEYTPFDYSAAVKNGEIVDQGEYQEMLEFSTLIAEKAGDLPASEEFAAIAESARELKLYVDQKLCALAIQKLRDLSAFHSSLFVLVSP